MPEVLPCLAVWFGVCLCLAVSKMVSGRVLQCLVMFYSVITGLTVSSYVLQCLVAAYLACGTVSVCVLRYDAVSKSVAGLAVPCRFLQCLVMFNSVLTCFTVSCSV